MTFPFPPSLQHDKYAYLGLSLGREYPDRNVQPLAFPLDMVVVSEGPTSQITRHLGRDPEGDRVALAAFLLRLPTDLRHVGERGQILGDGQRNLWRSEEESKK